MQHVVVAVGEATQVVQRPVLVLLGRVVEHDVEPHLDVAFVRRGRERSQLVRGGDLGRSVRPVDRAEHHRHVPPVVRLVGIEGVHRQQFEHAHAQVGEPIEFVDGGHERAPVGSVPGHREPPHVGLVDDERARRRTRGVPCGPVGRHRQRGRAGRRSAAGPRQLAIVRGVEPHRGRVRIDEHTPAVEAPCRVTVSPDPVPGAVRDRPPPDRPDRRERTVDAVDHHPHLLRIGRVDADLRHPLIMAATLRPCIGAGPRFTT